MAPSLERDVRQGRKPNDFPGIWETEIPEIFDPAKRMVKNNDPTQTVRKRMTTTVYFNMRIPAEGVQVRMIRLYRIWKKRILFRLLNPLFIASSEQHCEGVKRR